MCAPLAIAGAMAVMSMATTYMGIQQQNKAAEAQMEAASTAATQDYLILDRKEEQINAQKDSEAIERMRQGQRERAKMRVAMGESGLAGVTPLRTLANSFMQESYDTGIMETNRRANVLSVQDEKLKTYADAKSRINIAKSNTVSPFAAGLQIGGAGLNSGMSTYGALKSGGGKK